MRFELDETGAWIVDPDALAERLGVSGEYLRSQEDHGLVLSRVETGSGADEGRRRVTVVIDTYGWQGLFDRDGTLVSEQTFEPVSSFNAADRPRFGLHYPARRAPEPRRRYPRAVLAARHSATGQ